MNTYYFEGLLAIDAENEEIAWEKFRKLKKGFMKCITITKQDDLMSDFWHIIKNWMKIRKIILERDEYRCNLCGKRKINNKNLRFEIHHIERLENYYDENERKEKDIPENLLTFCSKCHKKLHKKINNKTGG